MSRRVIVFLLLPFAVLLAATAVQADEHKYGFKVYTVLASNFRKGFGPDLVLIKDDLKKTDYTFFTPINERKLRIRLGETQAIPIPGGSSFAISPKVFQDKKLYVDIFLTGNDKDFSFYDSTPVIGTMSGKAFIFGEDDSLLLIGPKTRWGSIIFVIHEIDL